MRVRVLHAKLYAYRFALPGSTARQLFISSTLLDSSTATRQTSTDLDRTRRPGAWSQARQARQELDSNSTGSTGKASTAPRQRLDSASTVPRRSLDSSTARQPGLNPRHAGHRTAHRPCAGARWVGLGGDAYGSSVRNAVFLFLGCLLVWDVRWPGHGGGSFLPWVSPPQRCPGVRRTPGIIGPGEARGVVITSIRRGVWPGEGIHCTRTTQRHSRVTTQRHSASLTVTQRHSAALQCLAGVHAVLGTHLQVPTLVVCTEVPALPATGSQFGHGAWLFLRPKFRFHPCMHP